MRAMGRLAFAFSVVFIGISADAAEEGLRLLVRTNKTTIAPFEPVILSFDLENISSEDQAVVAHTDPAVGDVTLEITDAEGRFRPYRTGMQGTAGKARFVLIPKERRSEQVIVLTNAFGRAAESNPTTYGGIPVFPFGEPGRYTIKVSLPLERDPDGTPHRKLVGSVSLTVQASAAATADLALFAGLRGPCSLPSCASTLRPCIATAWELTTPPTTHVLRLTTGRWPRADRPTSWMTPWSALRHARSSSGITARRRTP
jgi:hypothetical protein